MGSSLSNRLMIFTFEIGGESIPFCNLWVTLGNGGHEFEIYRKSTTEDMSVSFESTYHPRKKVTGFSWIIHWLVNSPLKSTVLRKKLNIIKFLEAEWQREDLHQQDGPEEAYSHLP